MKRPAIRAALALLLTVLLCAGANIAAFFIDTQTMRSNAAQGVAMLGEQGGIPQLIGGFKAAQLDNYTSVLILKTAAYTGEETLMQRAFGGTRTDMPTAEGQSAWEAYCTYADGSLSPTGGLAADLGGGACLLACTLLGLPVSTTHARTAALLGAGRRARGRVAGEIGLTWLCTFPGCGLLGFFLARLFLFAP